MLKKQNFPVYVLNLDRSKDRWDSLCLHAQDYGIEISRVTAVDGKLLQPADKQFFDEEGFRRDHGKTVLAAEIGCYLSHLKALKLIAEGNDYAGVIIEDDIRFSEEFVSVVEAALKLQGWDIIKLIHNRLVRFRPFAQLTPDVAIGRASHGPLGNAGAYIVTQAGAAKLLNALQRMHLPYDVALERGWAGSYDFFTAGKAVVSNANETGSTISTGRDSYSRAKLPVYRRIGTLIFRVKDYLSRIIYSYRTATIRPR
ncbi:glycosyltransferase family 25 protein [Pseudochrobactrum sp. MP213Fo]|uniref:glycosyltransferase family 25 protein n=1 Tax=Pseudochrobactrum sp. MP213Fo TaxID=3022250 RepID=UPI003B9F4D11